MEELILQPAALDDLEVEAIATAFADPNFCIFEEWCKMEVKEKRPPY